MNTDRELLEAAAKAAGIEVVRSRLDDPGRNDLVVVDSARNPQEKCGAWNPLHHDGDAFRLAVKLRIQTEHMCTIKSRAFMEVSAFPSGRGDCMHIEPYGDDVFAATRRAIVYAAAALGAAK